MVNQWPWAIKDGEICGLQMGDVPFPRQMKEGPALDLKTHVVNSRWWCTLPRTERERGPQIWNATSECCRGKQTFPSRVTDLDSTHLYPSIEYYQYNEKPIIRTEEVSPESVTLESISSTPAHQPFPPKIAEHQDCHLHLHQDKDSFSVFGDSNLRPIWENILHWFALQNKALCLRKA